VCAIIARRVAYAGRIFGDLMTQAAYELNGQSVSAAQFYAIACDPRRSVAVEACAGAGKTWMLVSRMIRALLQDDAPLPHEILAITFTKKAAGEMRQRLQEWLAEFAFATPEKLEFELKIRGIDLDKLDKLNKFNNNDLQPAYSLAYQLQNLYQKTLSQGRGVQIKTFHGWFASLLRTAPLSVLEGLNLPANYTLLEDDKLATPSVWRRFFGTLLKDETAKRDFEELVAEHGKSQALKALDEALSKRVEFQLADENVVNGKGLVDASVPHFAEFFPDFAGCESPEAAFLNNDASNDSTNDTRRRIFTDAAKILGAASQKTFSAKGVELEKAITDNDLSSAIAALLTEKGTPRKFNAALSENECVARAQDLALRFQSAIAQHAAWQHQQRMARLTRLLITEFAALKRQRGWVDMNDVERAALVMLSSSELSGWVQERLDARVKHLMIDEFQDTSPLQWQALYAWLSGYAGAGGKPPTVFIVGDPKQSIYRFRRAEPQVFIAAKQFVQDGLDGDLLSCDHTRRNALQVVQAVNAVMLQAQGMKQYSDYRAHSTEIALAGSVNSLPQIQREIKDKTKEKSNDSAEQVWRDSLTEPKEEIEEKIVTLECRQAAEFIQHLLQSGKKPKEIMVLARKRARLTLMQTELQALSIASQQPEKSNLADAPEVQDIIALLDVLASPTHDLSLAHVLKSPLFGVTDDDLVEIALAFKSAKSSNPEEYVSRAFSWQYSWFCLLQNSEQFRQEIRRKFDEIGAKLMLWKGWIDSLPPHDALDAIFHDGDVLARYASAAPTTRRDSVLANLNALLSAALDIDQARYLTPYAFVRAMKAGLSASNSDGDSDMADATQTVKSPMTSDDNAIRLLTIHGAKGLEADVVIILDTDAIPTPAASMRVLVDWPGETATPTSFVFLASESRPAPSAAAAFDIEKQARLREELNALYVAMTRARQQLVISSSQPRHSNADSWWQRMQAVSELGPTFPHPQSFQHPQPFPRRRESTSADIDSRLRGNDGMGADGHSRFNADVSAQIELLVLPSLENIKNTKNRASNMPLAGVFTAYDAIENVVISSEDELKSSLESRIGQAMHRLLQRTDLTAVDAVAIEFGLSTQDAEQAAQMAQRILAGEGAWAWDDAVIGWQGNEIELTAHGKLLRLDRLVRRKDTGEWWVLDYKSESQPQNKPELVSQMRAYVAAVQACYAGATVKAAFLTATGKMVEVH
jgi:ATP-dependent helicase/nuclease subunit A